MATFRTLVNIRAAPGASNETLVCVGDRCHGMLCATASVWAGQHMRAASCPPVRSMVASFARQGYPVSAPAGLPHHPAGSSIHDLAACRADHQGVGLRCQRGGCTPARDGSWPRSHRAGSCAQAAGSAHGRLHRVTWWGVHLRCGIGASACKACIDNQPFASHSRCVYCLPASQFTNQRPMAARSARLVSIALDMYMLAIG